MLSLFLLLACTPLSISLDKGDPGDNGGGADTSPVPALTLSGPGAIDPLLAPAITWTITETAGEALELDVIDPDGDVVRTLVDGSDLPPTVVFDGRDAAGELLPRGAYTIRGSLLSGGVEVATAERPVWVVRVGVSSGTLGGERVPLCWHAAGGSGMYYDGGADTPTFQIGAIDVDGVATPLPTPWEDLDAPPMDLVGQNLPAAYPYDATPTLSLVVAGETVGAPISARLQGWTVTGGAATAGETLQLVADTPLATSVGVVEPVLTLEWMTGEDVFATQSLPLRIYALYDTPDFGQTGLPYQPWVAAIDPLLRDLSASKVAATPEAVGAGVVDFVYYQLGLRYDTRYGASAYVQYRGNGYDGAHLDLTSFLSRSRGPVVNCTDCAGLVETYGTMIGLDLSYAIILQNYNLNQIRAIGSDTYSNCPFGPGGCGFSYHAVTTPDNTSTIYDATLALDGDDDPGSTPSTELMVHGIPGDEYLYRLVMSGTAHYAHVQKGTFQ